MATSDCSPTRCEPCCTVFTRRQAAIFFERGEYPGIARPATKEIASLSTRVDPDRSFVACAYQIPREEWEPLAEREEEFAFAEAKFEQMVCLSVAV